MEEIELSEDEFTYLRSLVEGVLTNCRRPDGSGYDYLPDKEVKMCKDLVRKLS